jgi:acyl-CoA thioester hydrolase
LETIRHRQQSEVAFSDTDASGWVHFSKILCYVERAEHAFLSSVDIAIFSNSNSSPRVKVDANGKPISITDDEHAKLLAE